MWKLREDKTKRRAADLALVEGQDRPVDGIADWARWENGDRGLYHAQGGTVRVHKRESPAQMQKRDKSAAPKSHETQQPLQDVRMYERDVYCELFPTLSSSVIPDTIFPAAWLISLNEKGEQRPLRCSNHK